MDEAGVKNVWTGGDKARKNNAPFWGRYSCDRIMSDKYCGNDCQSTKKDDCEDKHYHICKACQTLKNTGLSDDKFAKKDTNGKTAGLIKCKRSRRKCPEEALDDQDPMNKEFARRATCTRKSAVKDEAVVKEKHLDTLIDKCREVARKKGKKMFVVYPDGASKSNCWMCKDDTFIRESKMSSSFLFKTSSRQMTCEKKDYIHGDDPVRSEKDMVKLMEMCNKHAQKQKADKFVIYPGKLGTKKACQICESDEVRESGSRHAVIFRTEKEDGSDDKEISEDDSDKEEEDDDQDDQDEDSEEEDEGEEKKTPLNADKAKAAAAQTFITKICSGENRKAFEKAGLVCRDEPKDCSEDTCLFEEDFGPVPELYQTYCMQTTIPTGEGLSIEIGLNLETTKEVVCDANTPCKLGVKGTFGLGITFGKIAVGNIKFALGSIFYEGSLALSTDEGTTCPTVAEGGKKAVTERKSWDCGHYLLVKAYLMARFARGNMFNDPKFTVKMFKQVTQTKAELNAEKHRAEDDAELQGIIDSLVAQKGEDSKDEARLRVKAQMLPLYRVGKVWNTIFDQYWKPLVLEGILQKKMQRVPRHPFLVNWKDCKKEKNCDTNGIWVKMEDTLPALASRDAQYFSGDKKGVISYIDLRKAVVGNLIDAKNMKKKDSKKRKEAVNAGIRQLQILFLWQIRYLLESSIIQFFGDDPYQWTEANWFSGETNALNVKQKIMRLDHCSSLNVHFNGRIKRDKGDLAGFGAVPSGDTTKQDFRFRGRPRLLCSLAKSISNIDWGSEAENEKRHHPRNDCKIDYDACKNDGVSHNECKRCHEDSYREVDRGTLLGNSPDGHIIRSRIRKLQCKRALTTALECDPSDPPEYDPSMFYSGGEMVYQIPLASANMFPVLTASAVKAMKAFRDVRKDSTSTVTNKVTTAINIWKEWKTSMSQEMDSISDDWADLFKVKKAVEAQQIGGDWDSKSRGCKVSDALSLIEGKAYRVTSDYVNKIQKASAEYEKKFQEMVDNLRKEFQQKIAYEGSHAISGTFGGSGVGFCTPDSNVFQFSFPAAYRGVYDFKKDGLGTNGKGGVAEGSEKMLPMLLFTPLPWFQVSWARVLAQDLVDGHMQKSNYHEVMVRFFVPSFDLDGGEGGGSACLADCKDSDGNPVPADSVETVIDNAVTHSPIYMVAEALVMELIPVLYAPDKSDESSEKEKPDGLKDKLVGYLKRVKEKLSSKKQLSKVLEGGIMQVTKKVAQKRGEKSVMDAVSKTLGASLLQKQMYLFLELTCKKRILNPLKWKLRLPKCRLTASMLQINDLAFNIGDAGMQAVVGSGLNIDIGAMVNTVLQYKDTFKKEVPDETIVTDVDDKRKPRCKECIKQLETLYNTKASSVKCGGNAEEKDECEYVQFDILDYLDVSRKKTKSEWLWNSDFLKTALGKNKYVSTQKDRVDSLCKEYLGGDTNDQDLHDCGKASMCRHMGISCFTPGALGYLEECPAMVEGDLK
jgi:hypothetical protein